MTIQTFLDTIATPELQVIGGHWQTARGARAMPAWSDIDPVAIGRSLRYVWSWKYDRTAETFTGRLAGEDIVRAFGKSPRGMPMAEFFSPEVYKTFYPWHRRVVLEPACMRNSGMIYNNLGRNFTGERIMLPLAEDGSHGDGILGATVYRLLPDVGMQDESPQEAGDEQITFFPIGPATDAWL